MTDKEARLWSAFDVREVHQILDDLVVRDRRKKDADHESEAARGSPLLFEVIRVDLDEPLPLIWQVGFEEDRLDGALRHADAAVNALIRVDVVHRVVVRRVDAVHRADLDAGRILHTNAGLGNDIGHRVVPPSDHDHRHPLGSC